MNEVAVDALTRGALKEDATFKSIRDVIKKGCKVMENIFLVKRERKYTLYFRIIVDVEVGGNSMEKWLSKLNRWNRNVASAVELAQPNNKNPNPKFTKDNPQPQQAPARSISRPKKTNAKSGMIARGRSLLPSAGKVKSRRATPTPHRRAHHHSISNSNTIPSTQLQTVNVNVNAAEDGYATVISSSSSSGGDLTQQLHLSNNSINGIAAAGVVTAPSAAMALLDPTSPGVVANNGLISDDVAKEELTDMIRQLQVENMPTDANDVFSSSNANSINSTNVNIIPNGNNNNIVPASAAGHDVCQRIPTAEVPSNVPALPMHYIHRHRILTQVTNCLLDRRDSNLAPRDLDAEHPLPAVVTSITSRHADKAGNGKSVVMSSVVQSVDVRKSFCDGIIWLDFKNRAILDTEMQIRKLYEDLYGQLVQSKRLYDPDCNQSQEEIQKCHFQFGALEGIRHELASMVCRKKILLCLDNVARAEDMRWFMFHEEGRVHHSSSLQSQSSDNDDNLPFRILLTTRLANIVPNSNEVQVRILSEQEAVKYLLLSSGKKPFGNMKQSLLFEEAKMVVKGCGNSPLAVRIEGGILQLSGGRNWRRQSPAWTDLLSLGQSNFQEAAELRSFSNSLHNTIEYAFTRINDESERRMTRHCWVAFAYAFGDVLLSKATSFGVAKDRGIAKDVVLGLFAMIQRQSIGQTSSSTVIHVTPTTILATLETLNLIERTSTTRKARENQDARALKNLSNKTTNTNSNSGKSVGSSRSVLKGLVNVNSCDQNNHVAEGSSVLSSESTTQLELNFSNVHKSSSLTSYSMPTSVSCSCLSLFFFLPWSYFCSSYRKRKLISASH